MKALILPALLFCLLPACGSSDPRTLNDDGSSALNSGKYEKAASSYGDALAAIGDDESHGEWMRAKMGFIKAQTHLDAGLARDEFLKLAAAKPERVTDQEFSLIGGSLGDAGALEEAIAVLAKGKETHPESKHLDALMVELGKAAEQSGAGGALDALKGLGYVGGD
jgi:hypothetical protein